MVGFVIVDLSSTTMLGESFLVWYCRRFVSIDRIGAGRYKCRIFDGGGLSLGCVICYEAMFAQKGGMVIVKSCLRGFAAMENTNIRRSLFMTTNFPHS